MTFVIACILIGLAGTGYGMASDDPWLMILGFWLLLLAVSMIDWATDRYNARTHDRLNGKDANFSEVYRDRDLSRWGS